MVSDQGKKKVTRLTEASPQLTCSDCHMKYVGQARGTFKIELKEYLQAIRIEKQASQWAQSDIHVSYIRNNCTQSIPSVEFIRKTQSVQS